MKCLAEVVPFSALDDENYLLTLQGKNNVPHYLTSVPDCQLLSLYEKIKSLEVDEDGENCLIDNDNYYKTISELNLIKSNPSLSMLHLNIASLPFHIDELDCMINTIDKKFDFIEISETKLNKSGSANISLNNYTHVHCLSESSKGGTLIYVSDKHSFKERLDLQIYKSRELESTFVEIDIPSGKNVIVGCIYRHPDMSVVEFNNVYLMNLLKKLKKEQKSKEIYLMGDYNINLINYDSCEYAQEFVDLMASSEFLPMISAPTRVTTKSRTLIDNIFTNNLNDQLLAGNLTCSISDHLPQFALITKERKINLKEKTITRRDFKNFVKEDFILEIMVTDWQSVLKLDSMDPTLSTKNLIQHVVKVLDEHAPLVKSKFKMTRDKIKPWVTPGILT